MRSAQHPDREAGNSQHSLTHPAYPTPQAATSLSPFSNTAPRRTHRKRTWSEETHGCIQKTSNTQKRKKINTCDIEPKEMCACVVSALRRELRHPLSWRPPSIPQDSKTPLSLTATLPLVANAEQPAWTRTVIISLWLWGFLLGWIGDTGGGVLLPGDGAGDLRGRLRDGPEAVAEREAKRRPGVSYLRRCRGTQRYRRGAPQVPAQSGTWCARLWCCPRLGPLYYLYIYADKTSSHGKEYVIKKYI